MPHHAVSLRSLTTTDIPAVLAACANWRELSRWGPPYWRPRAEAELARKAAGMAGPTSSSEYLFLIEHQDESSSQDGDTPGRSRLVGECQLHAIDWRNRHAQIGVCIWRPDDRYHGYGIQAVEQLVTWARDELGLARLEASWILAGNTASHRHSSANWTSPMKAPPAAAGSV